MEKLKQIAGWLHNRGMTLYYVGGCVRDEIMGNTPDDIDICITGGATPGIVQEYLEILKVAGDIESVTPVFGKFPIWIVQIQGIKYEFAMARNERKVGLTRTEFECQVNNVTIEEDLERRDFTINAIAKNILTGEIVDPYSGQEAIEVGVIYPVSEAFKEDTLRVLRGARFCARFDFVPSLRFIEMARNLKPDDISDERVGKEVRAMFKTAKKPSTFFRVLRECRWLGYHFVELENLINVPQNPEHHPEGDAYIHTLHCMDAASDPFIRCVMLCHDLGKAKCTTIEDGKIKSIGHEEASVQLTKDLLKRIHYDNFKTIGQICVLVELHMIRAQMMAHNHEKIARRTLRRLMQHGLSYPDLVEVVRCDLAGRPPKIQIGDPDIGQDIMWNLILFDKMKPVVTGDMLIKYGIPPGPRLGEMTRKALELQDRGTLDETNWMERLRGAGFKEIKIIKT